MNDIIIPKNKPNLKCELWCRRYRDAEQIVKHNRMIFESRLCQFEPNIVYLDCIDIMGIWNMSKYMRCSFWSYLDPPSALYHVRAVFPFTLRRIRWIEWFPIFDFYDALGSWIMILFSQFIHILHRE